MRRNAFAQWSYAVLVTGILLPLALGAQSVSESAEHPPAFSTGVTAGAMQFAGGRTEQAMSVVLQYQPLEWLTLSAGPGFGRSTFGGTTTTGLTDIPLTVGAAYGLSLPWSPMIAASASTTLSPSDSAAGLGTGRSAFDLDAMLSASPIDKLNLSGGWSQPMSASSGNGSVMLESALSLGRATATLGFSSEMGRPDSGAVLSRSVATGLAFSLAGPLTLTLDGSRGVSGSAPSWTFSVGLGTAFAGLSPLDPSSPLRRLKKTFGSKVSASSGYAKKGSATSSCKKMGTC